MKKMKKIKAGMILLCLAVALSGCAAKEAAVSKDALPSPQPVSAPRNDARQNVQKTCLLYLPSVEGNQLFSVPVEAEFSVSRHRAEKLCQLLYAHPGNEYAAALPAEASLSVTKPVEVSGNTATVSLAAGALRLTPEELFLVGQATANTLGQDGAIQYVNLLINSVQPGLDLAATLPAGCFQPSMQQDLATLRSLRLTADPAARQTVNAALYYPVAGARGIACEARPLSFDSMEEAVLLQTLLDALQEGPVSLPGVPEYPDFSAYMTEAAQVVDDGGSKRVVLHFDGAFNQAIIDQGITRSVMAASLVYTLTTFMPGVEGVEIHIGDERIESLTPTATLTGAGETITFENGLIKRGDLSGFLLSGSTLYFAGAEGVLHASVRMTPYFESRNVRAIINQLMQGPQDNDSVKNLQPVLPKGLRDADLLGVAMEGDTLILHFSEQWLSLCQGMDQQQERNMIYAMVNALCELPEVKKVRFMVNDSQPETLAGFIYLPGSFLPNPDEVSNER